MAVDWKNKSSMSSTSLIAQPKSRWNRTKVIPGSEKSKLVHLRTLFPDGLKLTMKLEIVKLLFIVPNHCFLLCILSLQAHLILL